MTETLISAIKRKQLKEVVVEILISEGKEAEAQEMKEASRLTTALIDRTCVHSIEEELVPTVEDDEETICEDGFDPIRKAIKKGKGKKALKLCMKARKNGSKGSVLTDLELEAEAL